MRTIVGIALAVLGMAAPAAARDGDRDKALAVIDRAIKAHGGVDALNKARMRSRSGQGVVSLGGDVNFTTEEIVRAPDRCRMTLDMRPNRLLLVLNGDKGWMQSGGSTRELNKATFGERREELYVWSIMTLTPLRKKDFTLTPLADAKVNDRDAAVVRAAREGFPDARLFFDKKTGLLVKIARNASEAGVPVSKEYVYGDHKDFDGVKMPTKEIITLNGRKMSEVKFTRYTFPSRIDDDTFKKP